MVNLANFVTRVTHGKGCPAAPVSCSGGTTSIPNSYCILSKVI
jgi:hypothetical protein